MSFHSGFSIGSRRVGPGEPVLIIAEAGVSHFGDPAKALDLVDMAATAGADVFKTQAYVTDTLLSATLPEWRERLRPKEVGFDFIARMKAACDDRGLLFMCTAHDESVLAWLDQLQVPAFKIGSGERNNTPYFRAIASRGKPVLLSTGMYSSSDVQEALMTFADAGLDEVALLHCVTSYPTPYEQVNLGAMQALRELFPGPVGYSDHTRGHHVPLAAVALGAQIIEKHITLDFNVPNAQDWKVAAGPDDFADFVRSIREVEAARGNGLKGPQACEQPALHWALKSLVAARPLSAGTRLQSSDVLAKRAGGGIAPNQIDAIAGRTLARDVAADEALAWEDLR
jgi:N,N'-diacetyllegionaminate synthase